MDTVLPLAYKQFVTPCPFFFFLDCRGGGLVVDLGVKVDERCVVFVWPTSFHPRQAAGAAGCG